VSLFVTKGLNRGVAPRLLRLARFPIVERRLEIHLGLLQIHIGRRSAARCFEAMKFGVWLLGPSHDLLFLAHFSHALLGTAHS
jgi:hypothetical protein